jgi:hypothetical protein
MPDPMNWNMNELSSFPPFRAINSWSLHGCVGFPIPGRGAVNFPDVKFMAFPSFTTANSNGIGRVSVVSPVDSPAGSEYNYVGFPRHLV